MTVSEMQSAKARYVRLGCPDGAHASGFLNWLAKRTQFAKKTPELKSDDTRLNRYTCKACGGSIITVDRDKGVTPFMLRCRVKPGCSGDMVSDFYSNVAGEPDYEWRFPTRNEYRKMPPAMREHTDNGGLAIYQIVRNSEAAP